MKIKIWVGFIIVLSGSILSCNNDEFLKEIPETFYTTDNAFSTSSQVNQVIITLYSDVRSSLVRNSTTSRIRKGNGTDVFDVPSFRLSTSFADYSKVSANNTFFYTDFSFWYNLISKANTALYAANLSNITWSSDKEKQYAIAQAKFFRAYAYRSLGECYGGVPLVDTLETEARYNYKRSTRIETYQFAIDDLESIVDFLPETTTEGGRIVKGAAQHYLCELYLAMGIEMEEKGQNSSAIFSKAINYANQVIDGGVYSLMTNRFGKRADVTGKNVCWDLFQDDNINYQDGNRECVWAFQIDFNSYLAGDEESYLPYPNNYMPVLRSVPGMTGTAEDVGGLGVASVCPTMYARDLIWSGKFSDDLRNAECNIQRTFYYNNPAYPDLYGKVVPYSVLYADDGFRSYEFPIFWKLSTDKFVGLDKGQDRSKLFRDDYVIRLPETILLRAEAYLEAETVENQQMILT